MPGYCPAPLTPPAVRLWKTFRSKPNTIPVAGKKCSPSHRNAVRLQNGMLFGITAEWCSPSERNRVRLRPDSPLVVIFIASQICGDFALGPPLPDTAADVMLALRSPSYWLMIAAILFISGWLLKHWLFVPRKAAAPLVCGDGGVPDRRMSHDVFATSMS
jgi:hypothetical protein